jgi:hypothetical protein
MNTRNIIPAIATAILGFALGIFCAPQGMQLNAKLVRDNARLRQEVELHKQMMATYEEERAAVKDALNREKSL